MKFPSEIIREIEDNYSIETLSANGIKIWPILRNIIADKLEKKELNSDKKKFKKLIPSLQNYFWQRQNRRRHFSAILFTDSLEERLIDGKYSDKIAHNILKIFGKNLLVVTNSKGKKHRHISEYSHPNYLNSSFFTLPTKWSQKQISIENEQILESVNQLLNLNIDFQKSIQLFFAYSNIFHQYFLTAKLDTIFINCSYSILHQALIFSAKKQNIHTIELQHGLISKIHSAYLPSQNICQKTYPNYFLSFGKGEKSRITSNFINNKNIYPIGNYYLEKMKNKIMDKKVVMYFELLHKKYEKLVTISSQDTIEEELFLFIKEVSHLLPKVGFIFVPRQYQLFSLKKDLSENMILNDKIDLYTNTQFSDFHSSVYSSFSSEALFFETPNIMINIKGMANAYFSELFQENTLVKFVDTPKEYVHCIQNWHPNQLEFRKDNNHLFEQNNEDSIQNFLKILQ